jgi:hypothetical protein
MTRKPSDSNLYRPSGLEKAAKFAASMFTSVVISAAFIIHSPAFAEDELAAKYGGRFDASLVDQTCLIDKCSLQAKACLQDDPSCRKGLTCTAKCLGDNACITGCMARYGDKNLDNLLKCTIEDHECIKVAILDGGADKFGEEPRAPAPTVRNFNLKSMEGSWYKVVGYNPNYDCYACQRNTFSSLNDDNIFVSNNKLKVDVEFSMPRLMPDGTPPPPANVRERIQRNEDDGLMYGSQSVGFNDYETHETMVFDNAKNPLFNLVLNEGNVNEVTYSRTAHSEGEMFGLSKFCALRLKYFPVMESDQKHCCCLQNFGRTGMLLARMIQVSQSSNLFTITERLGRILTRVRLCTQEHEISPRSP